MKMVNKNIIAIDGHSYVGKSTIAKELSILLGCIYVNTGHLYRAVAKHSMDNSIPSNDHNSIVSLAKDLNIEFKIHGNTTKTFVNNEDLTKSLDSPDLVSYASKIATIYDLREILNEIQRSYSKNNKVIFEGRDLGTVVFPEALWKFYITASLHVRARRMKKILLQKEPHQKLKVKDFIPKVDALDRRDTTRKIAPLKKADDAIVYDNSDSPSEIQDALILQYYINHKDELIENASLLTSKENN